MADKLILRKAKYSDAKNIIAIEEGVQPVPWPRQGIERELRKESADSWFWCLCSARDPSQLYGYLCFRMLAGEGYILNLAIKKGCHRRGYGTLLLHYLFLFLKRKGTERLVLDVCKENTGAISFYLGQGFSFSAPPEKIRGKFCVMEMKLFQE